LSSKAQAKIRQTQTGGFEQAAMNLKDEAKDLVAQFSGEEPLERLCSAMSELSTKLENNQEAQKWWKEFKDLTLKVVKDYQKQDLEKFRDLFQREQQIFRQFRPKMDDIIEKGQDVITNITNDELSNVLREKIGVLADDLYWKDKDGNRVFDQDAAGHLIAAIGEIIRQEFTRLPLPRIERTEGGATYSLDNIVIEATLPDKISFHLESFAQLDLATATDPNKGAPLKTEIYLSATIAGVKAIARDATFTYQGTLNDSGVVTLAIPEPGATLVIDFVMRPVSRPSVNPISAPTSTFTTMNTSDEGVIGTFGGNQTMRYEFVKLKTHFDVPEVEIDFKRETLNHKILFPLLTGWFKIWVHDRFETGVMEALDDGLVSLGQRVIEILNQAPNALSLSEVESTLSSLTK